MHMALDRTTARERWFDGFDRWQATFNAMLLQCTKVPAKVSMIGKAFLQDTMIPFMDEAKDRLLAAIAKQVQDTCEKAIRLDQLVNKNNE